MLDSIVRLAKHYGVHMKCKNPRGMGAMEMLLGQRPYAASLPNKWGELKRRYDEADDIQIGNMILPGPDLDHLWITQNMLSFFSFGDGSFLAYDFEYASDVRIVWIQCDPVRACVVAQNIEDFLFMLLVDVAVYGRHEVSTDRMDGNRFRALSVASFNERPYDVSDD